jgi:DNA-binding NarL/FixJ family response regulator
MTSPAPPERLIRLLLVDDHQILTDALSALLSSTPDLDVVGTAGTLDGCRAMLARVCPNVIVMDVSLPDGDGIAFIPQIRERCPDAAVLVLTSLSDEATLQRAVEAGANGFVPKHRPLVELAGAIRQAAAGEIVMPASLLLGLLQRVKPSRSGPATRGEALTPRELEILALLARGKSSPDIAAALSISPATVRTHIGNAMVKLGVHSRLEAVSYALRHGLIAPPL